MSGAAWVAFVIACMVGAGLRSVLTGVVGTFVINVTGSLLLGVIVGLALYHGLDDTPHVVVGTGFCGAYTTFSSMSFETVQRIEKGTYAAAARYALSTLFVCLGAAAVGLAIAAA